MNSMKRPCAKCPFRKDCLEGWLGDDAPDRFRAKVEVIRAAYDEFVETSGLGNSVRATLAMFNKTQEDDNDE